MPSQRFEHVVVDRDVVHLRVTGEDPGEAMRIEVQLNDGSWHEALPQGPWSPVSHGVSFGTFYLWTWTGLWSFAGGRLVYEIEVEHDTIFTAWRLADGWLLACELSAQLWRGGRQVAWKGLRDVGVESWLDGETLTVREFDGYLRRFKVNGGLEEA